jgi:hypothetical protein
MLAPASTARIDLEATIGAEVVKDHKHLVLETEVNPLKKFSWAIEFNHIQKHLTRVKSDKEMSQNHLLMTSLIRFSRRYLRKPMKMNLARKKKVIKNNSQNKAISSEKVDS